MKKKIAGLLTVFAVALFLSGCGQDQDKQQDQNQNQQSSQQSNGQQSQEQEGIAGSFSGSIVDLMKRGNALKCEWSMDNPEQKGDGVVYVSGENYRQELNLTEPQSMKAFAISDDDFIYSWTSQADTGVKMKVQEAQRTQSPEQQSEQSNSMKGVDADKNFDFNCSRWDADESMFNPPEDIEFMDFSQQMNQMQEQMQNQMQDPSQGGNTPSGSETSPQQMQQQVPCSMCNNLSGEAKQECLENCK
ncbi:MAG: hypothetical protein U5L10_03445 [Candidatus Moranbacteria bacterium]|nr:hypothetical protein [Candidatus Moranbacteria bacterium]